MNLRNWSKTYTLALLIIFTLKGFGQIEVPDIIISNTETEINISQLSIHGDNVLKIGDQQIRLSNDSSQTSINFVFDKETLIELNANGEVFTKEVNPIPLWYSIIPPLIAIILALILKEVITSLILGIFIGSVIIQLHSHFFLWAWFLGFMRMIDHYIIGALNDPGHLSIIVFSLLIGGMVSVISKNGGMQGVVNRISKRANTAKSGQLATWFLGIAIFFDDYANTLIVGNTMRPITDKLKISREKLAYLVDSTAAPIAAIAFVTTWIGAELGYIESGINNIEGLNEGVYATFIHSLSYSYYPILALLFMLMLILKNRDFGPMLLAERAARNSMNTTNEIEQSAEMDEFKAEKNIPIRSFNAIIPIVTVVLVTLIGLLYTGWDDIIWNDEEYTFGRKLSAIIGNADSYLALLWASTAGLIAAIKLSIFQKILGLGKAINAALTGIKTMIPAITILILAWALAMLIDEMRTADFLTSMISDSVSVYLVPALTFLISALVAFSTGSSWGTMAILYPLMLPLSWKISTESGMTYDQSLSIFHNTVACVLAGAVLGDHCSPISDTTILSSLASSCNHIRHVKTQMPYALTVGSVALFFGIIPASMGVPFLICLPVALFILYLIVRYFAKEV